MYILYKENHGMCFQHDTKIKNFFLKPGTSYYIKNKLVVQLVLDREGKKMRSFSVQRKMIDDLGLVNSNSQSGTYNAQKFCKNTIINYEKLR